MDPTFFYEYVNQHIYMYYYSKYAAIIKFLDDDTVDFNYKLIPQVMDELYTTQEHINNMSQTNNITQNNNINNLNNKNIRNI
jgi:hypothetical protein